MKKTMNVDQTPKPTERTGIRERIADAWNSRNRVVTIVVWLSAGLVLNCCCIVIPLWDSSGGP